MTCKLQQPPHNCDWPQVTDFKETCCSLSHSSTLSSAECFKMLTLTVCNTQIHSICMFYMYHQHFHNVEHNNHITCTANEPTPGVFTWCVYLGHTASLFTSCFKQLLYKDLGEFLCCNRAADFKWDVTFSRRVCGNLTRIKARCRDIFRLCLWQQTSLSQTLCQNKISSQF